MTLELNEDGLQTQTQLEITDEQAEKIRQALGVNTKTEAISIMGQLINIVGELRAIDQQALAAAYESFDPSGARGRVLDARMALTGTTRAGATYSYVEGQLKFTAGGGTMSNGDLIKNDDNSTYWELTSGPHSPSGPYPEYIDATFQCTETGPVLANAGTTWSLVTVVTGLDSFANATDDAEPGRDQEADAAARTRRLTELHAQGQGPLAAIKGYLSSTLASSGLLGVNVYHNPDVYPADSDNIPFKAFNVVVETLPATPTATQQQAIYDAIWQVMGAGGEAYGTDYTGTVTDSEGNVQPVAFDVVDVKDIVIEIDLVTSTSEDPITPNIEDVVAAQVLAVAQADYELVGRDVRALDYEGIVNAMLTAGTITGVDDVVVRLAISPASPTLVAKLAIGIREKADFDSANLTVAQT